MGSAHDRLSRRGGCTSVVAISAMRQPHEPIDIERILGLPLHVTGLELQPLQLATSAGWTRHTTVVRLLGPDHEGVGEDITYETDEQTAFQGAAASFALDGEWTLGGFSALLDRQPLFATPSSQGTNWLFRRWAFESAGLDLALQQGGTNLAEFLGRTPQPVQYVVSTGLGRPPGVAGLEAIRDMYPGMRFKVDFAESWTQATVAALAALDAVDTVDLKAHYRGSFQGPPPDARMYAAIAEGLPGAWLEDPAWSGPAWDVLGPHRERVTWDAVLHSFADLVQLPVAPRCVNIKPSRFGCLGELLRVYAYCENAGIAMYGGGQFELGPGRGQLQVLASLFHPSAGNDVAPSRFNESELSSDLPPSPLAPRLGATGFRWTADPTTH